MCEYCHQDDWYCRYRKPEQIINKPSIKVLSEKETNKTAMTKQEYFGFAERFFSSCVEISRSKNADYTGKNDDPFSNFKSVEILGITTEQGFLTRMMDKMKRIASFAENGQLQVKDESVTDTLKDLANYSCLLAAYINSKREESKSGS